VAAYRVLRRWNASRIVFGDPVFPQIGAMFGHPAADIAFGLLGALFATFVYELVAMFGRLG
jgi:hypothetical protein